MDERFAEILAHLLPKVPSVTSFSMKVFGVSGVVSGFTLTLNPLFCILIAVLDSCRRFSRRGLMLLLERNLSLPSMDVYFWLFVYFLRFFLFLFSSFPSHEFTVGQ